MKDLNNFGVVTGFLANRFLPSGETEMLAQQDMGQDSLRAVLKEITKLQAAQDQAYAEIDAKIELLFAQLQENPK